MGFEFIARTHVGLRRKINEDSLLAQPEGGLWVVADGMGGHEAGEVASAKVTQALGRLPPSADLDALVREASAALDEVNRELIELARCDFQPRTIGSTVVAVAIANREFRCLWAGDSRAYRVRGRRIERLTRDHSLVQKLVDAGLLSEEEAVDHPDANVVTRAVGASRELEIDVVRGDALPGDRFILASDGLTRVVDDEELLAAVVGTTPGHAAQGLLETVLARGAPDNVSIIIARLT